MKKIFSILCMLALTLSFVACSDDNDEGAAYNRPSTISVVKSDVLFSANAGTGYIQLNAQNPISVEGMNDWCNAQIVGDSTVEVSVNNNASINGRACQLVVKSGVDSVNVTVQQQGFVFSLQDGTTSIASGDAATTKRLGLKTNGTPFVETSADWVTATIEEDSLKLDLASNATGHLRQAYVKISFGEFSDSIKVSQYDFKKDLAGDYYLAYYNQSGKLYAMQAELAQIGSGYQLTFPSAGLTLPVSFDSSSCQLTITAGTYMGPFDNEGTTLYIYALFGNASTGNLYINGQKMSAPFEYNDEDGTIAGFDSSVYDYLSFYAFEDKQITQEGMAGALAYMFSPFLMKLDDAEAAKQQPTILKTMKFGK